jgi:hypothetical protein
MSGTFTSNNNKSKIFLYKISKASFAVYAQTTSKSSSIKKS